MSDIYDGGPAFPRAAFTAFEFYDAGHCGMYLRDHFAGLAMQGICAARAVNHAETGELEDPTNAYLDRIADMSYVIADAMLRARKSGGAA